MNNSILTHEQIDSIERFFSIQTSRLKLTIPTVLGLGLIQSQRYYGQRSCKCVYTLLHRRFVTQLMSSRCHKLFFFSFFFFLFCVFAFFLVLASDRRRLCGFELCREGDIDLDERLGIATETMMNGTKAFTALGAM
jgi:hypothetical protein